MKHFINLKDIPAKDLRKILIKAKKRIILYIILNYSKTKVFNNLII